VLQNAVSMLETSARLLRLLSLLTARRFWSGAELAQRLEVTERTLRRDIDKLRSLGYPVSSTSGVAGGYQLGAGASLPPLLLEDDEALAVAVGLRSAASGSVTGAEESAARALSKLQQVLPARLRKRVEALRTAVVPLHLAGPPVDPDAIAMLAGASRDHEIVGFDYEDRTGAVSARRVEPHGLVSSGARWYLAAWDLDREAFRTFRVDRVGRVARGHKRFVPRPVPEGSVAAYVSRSVATGPYDVTARVILHAPYEDIAQRVSPLAARLEPIDASRCLLEAGGRTAASLGLYIAMLDCEFEVLDPPELKDALRRLARRMARAACR
jgi:predicted DNA-binding transcriptional regulator YafY